MCLADPQAFGLKNALDEPTNGIRVLEMAKNLNELLVNEKENERV